MLPAPGYRHRDTGALLGVSKYGYSWSSAVSTTSTSGLSLSFNVAWLNTSYTDLRVYGFQLRCLSE
ncbi:hypothetical protein [uncultured Rikenella sp.]|uniref:hypothetical protein n=1 Tax=uncultured Rikenella sp. TaxID=368003 RepID=UPI00261FF390|nr:hypothetical protein [uncultured Rikenella sp.]